MEVKLIADVDHRPEHVRLKIYQVGLSLRWTYNHIVHSEKDDADCVDLAFRAMSSC